jgi:hypothetical protein
MKFRVTVKATRQPHKGRHFTYLIDALTKVEAIDLAKQYAASLDRVTSAVLYKCEEIREVAA